MKKNFSSFAVLFIFFLTGYHFLTAVNFDNIKYIQLAGQEVRVILALTEKEHAQGLSNREELKENEGMLFIFNTPDQYSFWMKDMKFVIDMIWIGNDLRVVYIKKNILPESYPEVYTPTRDAKYVLEVNAGFAEKNNLKEGDRVEFTF